MNLLVTVEKSPQSLKLTAFTKTLRTIINNGGELTKADIQELLKKSPLKSLDLQSFEAGCQQGLLMGLQVVADLLEKAEQKTPTL